MHKSSLLELHRGKEALHAEESPAESLKCDSAGLFIIKSKAARRLKLQFGLDLKNNG
jgi:hypothetical protein